MNRKVICGLATLGALLITSSAMAAAHAPLPDPRGEQVVLRGLDVASAGAVVAGRGIEGIKSQPVVDDAGRELVWKQVRRDVDSDGNIHVFYRQHLSGDGVTAEVYGSEVGVHYNSEGKLWSVRGTQFREVNVANSVYIDRENAIDAASHRMLSENVRVRRLPEMSDELRERSVGAAKLMLVERGGEFRYTYFTYASDGQDNGYQIVVDADTEEVMAVTSTNMGGNCIPTGPMTMVSAVGTPVRTDIPGNPTRSIKAHPATDRPAPYTHEGYWHSSPYKTVYQQTSGDGGLWMCNPALSSSWAIVPLKTENGVAVYKNWPGEQWRGSAAGDALYHSDLTMRFIRGMGRNGWDDNYGAVKIIIEKDGILRDQVQFNSSQGNPTATAPTNSVMISVPGRMYNAAASLDWVAHEWGHGVIDTSANFPYSGVGAELHEGFADVIGHMAEKKMQDSGSGLEKSNDWTLQEDSAVSGYARGVIDDNSGHPWTGPTVYNGSNSYTFNDLLHANDTPTTSASIHSHGNKLSVVYKLLSDGGQNPVCSPRLPGLSGCTTTVPAITFTKASKILFAAIEFHLPSYSTWSSLADSVADAAFASYNQCSTNSTANAAAEQQAVFDAFRAIGHPSATGTLNTCF